ncbi:MAG: substrate-binding domain-containing protein [Lachnospiraceae bacterium]|nr:substrate-binding domain-containing protein [Lachnospiraceae bacterium]
MKKKCLALLATAVMALTLAACGGNGNEPATDAEVNGGAMTEAGGDTFTIGFSNRSADTPFFANMTFIIEDYAAEKGIEVVAINANNDVEKQNRDIQDLLQRGIDVLIINPVNEEGPSAGIRAANDAGVPIITIDMNVASGADVWVGRDNYNMGYLVGNRLIELLGGIDATGTVLEIQGAAGSTTMMARRDGFNAAMESVPGLTIVQSAFSDFDRSRAIPATQDLIQAHGVDVVAIFAHNDDMALGAAQVVREQNIENVLVTGIDGLMEAVLAIQIGDYQVTASNDPVLLSHMAVDAAIALMNGEDVPDFIDAGTVIIDLYNVDDYADPDLDFATMVGN